jgi:flavin reductase (DIM6/NTAB) family NADH-FMN oxidoreductase RutF
MTFDPNELESSAIYKLLTGTIIPRPIGWISSISEDGINNLAPFSYFNMLGDDPPHVMFSTRRDNNTNKDTLNNGYRRCCRTNEHHFAEYSSQ